MKPMMPLDFICSPVKCTGCSLCAAICPSRAITMEYDQEGFLRPVIEEDICIQCGLCQKKCIANSEPKVHHNPRAYYLAFARNEGDRMLGSSGGIFPVLARHILQKGGAVTGAAFDESLQLHHIMIKQEDELVKLCGSKYLQSETWEIYTQVYDMLMNNQWVLFVGTPCQVDALRTYCGALSCDTLVTCDLICYGVGSTAYFNSVLKYLEEKYGAPVSSLRFREKSGNRKGHMNVRFENGKTYKKAFYLSEYGLPFSRMLINRLSCFTCPYATPDRSADLTLGDYPDRGIEALPAAEIKKGVSLLQANTPRGRELLQAVKDHIIWEEKKERDVLQIAIRQSRKEPDPTQRNQFMKDYIEQGFLYTQEKYCLVSRKNIVIEQFDTQLIKLKHISRKIAHCPPPEGVD